MKPGLRERRRMQTRREISRAALDLVLEHGLSEVTVDDIAKAAGISPRTFFNYFPSKKSAVVPGPPLLPDEAVEAFVADRTSPVLDGLVALFNASEFRSGDERAILRKTIRALEAHPELVPVLHERIMEFESAIIDAVARRLDVPPTDDRPLTAAAVLSALLRTTLIKSGVDRDLPPDHDIPDLDLPGTLKALRALIQPDPA